ncbi:hypothetical protein ACFSGX_07875 [Sphingomonas arantia]|uniref:Gene transfer agent family protein n=1 Tax=Sphingomonas arantia TaxID=1460676 RepID=A0ABW4TVW5_9SPHN
MTTATKNEVGFAANGLPWTLVYDFNALCSIEEALGETLGRLTDLSSPTRARTVFRVGLEHHHGVMTDAEAGAIIQDIGVEKAGELIGYAFQLAFPDPAETEDGGSAKPAPRRRVKKAETSPAR